MKKLLFTASLILFPLLSQAQVAADGQNSDKIAENTECRIDSTKTETCIKGNKPADERQPQLQKYPSVQTEKRLPLEADKKRKKRGTGFFVQGGVGVSFHR